ncbi:MAG: ribosomal RNA large subunit methyltransferase M [Lysobacteraceae bacterium]|nr:MAG: ribosomal RNA large subunit methyltransferase M [Xanthomonadaceae bacterium]
MHTGRSGVEITPREGLLAWCRPGFEGELAAELGRDAAREGRIGHVRARRGDGLALFLLDPSSCPPGSADRPWTRPIFARGIRRLRTELRALDPTDRLSPVLEALETLRPPHGWSGLVVEHPDSDAGKPLAPLARGFGRVVEAALARRGWLQRDGVQAAPVLHLALLATDHLLLAESCAGEPPWPGGIPRLRLLREAPSRSALKLEEALLVLLRPEERQGWLQPGMQAADLGAAPGGWSWVLARHHLDVTAVDNGPMAASALATGLIRHLRADGFTFRPQRPLDWMVCDMVEQPARVAARIATWLREGWCRQTIFNLKLPMKKRLEEVDRCLGILQDRSGRALDLRARQLYHDREEITVFARPSAS